MRGPRAAGRPATSTGVSPPVLSKMNVGRRPLSQYQSLVDRDLMAEVRELAADVRGLRVCNISASGEAGGVAELLASTVPLFNHLGVESAWRVLGGRPEFFRAAGVLHDGLQGARVHLDDAARRTFERHSLLNAGGLDRPYDVVVVHDPEPLGMREGADGDDAVWIWRCHLDMSSPDPGVFDAVRPMLDGYALGVYHMPGYVPRGGGPEPVIIPPAIDPLTPKNMALPRRDAADIVAQFGVDPDRPLMVQVSRFDPWKDPVGVIDAFREARREVPGLQVALVGPRGGDVAGGRDCLDATVDHAAGDPDIHLLWDAQRIGAVEVNAFQTAADVVVQKSLREGFGLTVTEALWKARPTVASDVGGIPSQIVDGETGHLAGDPAECAARVVEVLRDPVAAGEMGRRGKQHVRHQFLTPRLIRDWLGLLRRVAQSTR